MAMCVGRSIKARVGGPPNPGIPLSRLGSSFSTWSKVKNEKVWSEIPREKKPFSFNGRATLLPHPPPNKRPAVKGIFEERQTGWPDGGKVRHGQKPLACVKRADFVNEGIGTVENGGSTKLCNIAKPCIV